LIALTTDADTNNNGEIEDHVFDLGEWWPLDYSFNMFWEPEQKKKTFFTNLYSRKWSSLLLTHVCEND
jgi:hypothetical protein